MVMYERLLRKQRVAVPQARVEAILQEEDEVDQSGEDSAPVSIEQIDKWIDSMSRLQEEAASQTEPATHEGSQEADPAAVKKEK
jgi:hypothetical protein